MLKRWEMKVTSVEGGEEALTQLCAAREMGEPYGLVLTDMHMPGMDGFALVERIRERPELSTATIMMLTSVGHRRDAARCHELGVSAHLLKPIRQSELREGGCQSTWGQGTARRDSADHTVLPARCPRTCHFVARSAGGRQCRESAVGEPAAGKERPLRGGSWEWTGGA